MLEIFESKTGNVHVNNFCILNHSMLPGIREGRKFLLTKNQLEIYENFISFAAYEVIKKYSVLVCTVGSLADHRLMGILKKGEDGEHVPVQALMVDEIGQLPQYCTFSLFGVNPRRIVFAGDFLQLRKNLNSYSAFLGGLDKSVMEWISESNERESLPWITLKEQHRMAPAIRQLVSTVFYNNELRDAEAILLRMMKFPWKLLEMIPELRSSPIQVIKHENEESTVRQIFP